MHTMNCPNCNGPVELDTDCPGYGEDPVMVCMPACGNMTICECIDCGWQWSDLASKRITYRGWSESPPPVGWTQPVEPILNLARRGPGAVSIRVVNLDGDDA